LRGTWWHVIVLKRLKRSLEKLRRNNKGFHYNAMDWSYLQDGYGETDGQPN